MLGFVDEKVFVHFFRGNRQKNENLNNNDVVQEFDDEEIEWKIDNDADEETKTSLMIVGKVWS